MWLRKVDKYMSVRFSILASGRTLYEVQHILGHTQVKTTQRYAHLSQDTLLAAANAATLAVGAVMLPEAEPSQNSIDQDLSQMLVAIEVVRAAAPRH